MITTRVYKPEHQRSKIIDGKQYSIFLARTDDGLSVATEIIRFAAPVFAVIMDNDTNEDIRMEESTFFSQIAAHICLNLTSESLIQMVEKLLDGAYCGSHKIEDWRDHFAGDYFGLTSILEWSLRENFGDFFIKTFKARGFEIHTLKAMFLQKVTGNNLSKTELTDSPQSPTE